MEEVKGVEMMEAEKAAEAEAAKEIIGSVVQEAEEKKEIQIESEEAIVIQVTESAPAGSSTTTRLHYKLMKRKARAQPWTENDRLASVLLSTLMAKVNSQVLTESAVSCLGLGTELEKIKSTVSKIQAVLPDARKKQWKNEAVKDWLKKIHDVAFDANGVLDKFTLDAQRLKKHCHKENVASLFLHLVFTPFRFQMARKLKKIGEKLDAISRGRDYLDLRPQVVDSEGSSSSSDWTPTSLSVEESEIHGKDELKEESLTTVSDREVAHNGGESSSTIETTRWTLLIINLLIECLSAIFDQLGFALLGMVMAFIALILSIIDIIHMAQKREISWDGRSLLPCFCHHPTPSIPARKAFCSIVECFGLVGAVWQCFYSTVQYTYARQNKDNPIKMCLLPFIFVVCVIIIKFVK